MSEKNSSVGNSLTMRFSCLKLQNIKCTKVNDFHMNELLCPLNLGKYLEYIFQ